METEFRTERLQPILLRYGRLLSAADRMSGDYNFYRAKYLAWSGPWNRAFTEEIRYQSTPGDEG